MLALSPIVTTTEIDQQIETALTRANTISTNLEGLLTKILAHAYPMNPPEIPLKKRVANPMKYAPLDGTSFSMSVSCTVFIIYIVLN